MITVCAWCKRVRGEDGIWRPQTASDAPAILAFQATHDVCPSCKADHFSAPSTGVSTYQDAPGEGEDE